MEDTKILELYFARRESAIAETDNAYGRQLHTLADRIVRSFEDAQECVSDTYLKARFCAFRWFCQKQQNKTGFLQKRSLFSDVFSAQNGEGAPIGAPCLF